MIKRATVKVALVRSPRWSIISVFLYIFPMSLSVDVVSKIIQCLIGLNVYKIILFGSYARGTATEDSDIDLVVILDTEDFAKSLNERLDRKQPINKSIRKIRKDFPMDIVVYSKGEYNYLKDRGDFFIKEIEETGKELFPLSAGC